MEQEVVAGVGDLVHLPSDGGGSMTSGGTESILMSMLVNRERARQRGVERPTIVAPFSAHPAYAKAAHFLGMEIVTVPLAADLRADVAAARELVDDDTAVVVASAFNYPYGIVDPVEELAALAAERGAACHVDGCIGGFVLPFLEELGRPVPPWDFRVEGVTEISADIHKYGYTPKGASVILHRDADWRNLQWFLYDVVAVGHLRLAGRGRSPTCRADRHRLGRHGAPRPIRLPRHRPDPARGDRRRAGRHRGHRRAGLRRRPDGPGDGDRGHRPGPRHLRHR